MISFHISLEELIFPTFTCRKHVPMQSWLINSAVITREFHKRLYSFYNKLRDKDSGIETVSHYLITTVESLDASVISKLPFMPSNAGTRMKISVTF